MAVLHKFRRNLLKLEVLLCFAVVITIYQYLYWEPIGIHKNHNKYSPVKANKFDRKNLLNESDGENKKIDWCSRLR